MLQTAAMPIDSMVHTGETPWYGLGLRMDRLMTVDEACALAMSWKVREQSVYYANPDTKESIRVPGFKALVRDDNHALLGLMGENYAVMQNDEHADFLKRVIGKEPVVEVAGVLDGGRKVWMLCRFGEPIQVPTSKDDIVIPYLLSYTSHDGSLAHSLLPTSLRLLNQSTFEAGPGIKVRHTARMEAKVREAQRALGLVAESFHELREEVPKLARAKFSKKQMAALAAHLFPPTPVQKDGLMLAGTEHVSGRNEEARQKLLHLYEEGEGQENCRGTAWAALNAVLEFTDHHRTTRVTGLRSRDERTVREARLQSVWFGASRELKQDARAFIDDAI